ncbi:MAG: ABC transporter ATP-binding protein [Deltaproteobacteria bacterium]|nr:ABC transporter ATP-binding protein [Deltaproteobacteria bacterium]
MIKIQKLSKLYPDVGKVLDNIDLDIGNGEIVALQGPSGAGKTTLLNIVGGLDNDYSGFVSVRGRELSRLSDRALSAFRADKIGFVFQSFHLLPHLSVIENVMLPSFFSENQAKKPVSRAEQLLEDVGLEKPWSRKASTLSGGQKQRTAVARAIFNEPELLLCDEPTGNLDAETGEAILDLLVDISKSTGLTLLMVTHEARVSGRAMRTLVLDHGTIKEQGRDEP